jgi:hypothetical protein
MLAGQQQAGNVHPGALSRILLPPLQQPLKDLRTPRACFTDDIRVNRADGLHRLRFEIYSLSFDTRTIGSSTPRSRSRPTGHRFPRAAKPERMPESASPHAKPWSKNDVRDIHRMASWYWRGTDGPDLGTILAWRSGNSPRGLSGYVCDYRHFGIDHEDDAEARCGVGRL